jgi:hypothetical protein
MHLLVALPEESYDIAVRQAYDPEVGRLTWCLVPEEMIKRRREAPRCRERGEAAAKRRRNPVPGKTDARPTRALRGSLAFASQLLQSPCPEQVPHLPAEERLALDVPNVWRLLEDQLRPMEGDWLVPIIGMANAHPQRRQHLHRGGAHQSEGLRR